MSNQQVLTVAADGALLTRTPGSRLGALGRTVDPSRPGGGIQFAGTSGSGVPITADALQKFEDWNGYVRIEEGHPAYPQLPMPASTLAVDPQDRNRLYAATSAGLFRSRDNGWTWSLLREGPSLAIAIDPFDYNRLYLSTGAVPSLQVPPRVYRTIDGGANWTAVYSGSPGSDAIASLAADPNVRGLLYGAGRSLFRSTDGGDTWDTRRVGPSRQDISPWLPPSPVPWPFRSMRRIQAGATLSASRNVSASARSLRIYRAHRMEAPVGPMRRLRPTLPSPGSPLLSRPCWR